MANTRTTRAPAGTRARQTKPPPPSITFMGEKYRIADKIGVMPLLMFAAAAESGLSLSDQKGLAAMYRMLEDCIHPDDWGRFQTDITFKKVDDLDKLMKLTNDAVEMMQAKAAKNGNGAAPEAVTAEVEET